MAFSPYECAQGRISPPKNVHMSHIEMTKHTGYTLPLFVTNRQMNQEEGGKEEKMKMMHEGCKMNEKMKLKH